MNKATIGWVVSVIGVGALSTAAAIFISKKKDEIAALANNSVAGSTVSTSQQPCTDANAANNGAFEACRCKDGFFISNGVCVPKYVPPVQSATCDDPGAKNYGQASPCQCRAGFTLTNGVCVPPPQAGGFGYLGKSGYKRSLQWTNSILWS